MSTGLMVVCMLAGASAFAGGWSQLASLPDAEGFAGSFAGVSGEALLVAGGANFPEAKPWEGGTKRWYDTVFVLDRPNGGQRAARGEWRVAGKLPRPLGYGVSVTDASGVVCVGGSDSEGHYADVFRLTWENGELATQPLPSLPEPIANMCGALVGNVLYIAGGQRQPHAREALRSCYRLDLASKEPEWERVESWPGRARILAVACGLDGAFYLAGGAELIDTGSSTPERRYLKDAYCYDPKTGWQRIADLPYPVAAAPSPAAVGESGFFILGGDDGSQLQTDPDKHRGFRKTILHYDVRSQTWNEIGEAAVARVVVPCVFWNDAWVLPNGEVRPGIRSPEVWSWAPKLKE